jgi:IstB-like ATP binding protein
MERSELFDLMGELQLYGMKAAFDEIMTTAVKRQHEPQRIIGDLLTAEINEKEARSIKYQLTIAKLPLAKDLDDFQFEGTPINETLVHDLASGGFLAQQRNAVLVGGTGTGKTHLAIAIARSCIRSGARGRFYNVVDLVNRLETEARNARQGRLADHLTRMDFVILGRTRLSAVRSVRRPAPVPPHQPALRAHLDHRHHQSRLRRMAERLHRRQDDHSTARSPHSPLRYHRNWKRQLALQKPRRRSPHNPRSRRLRNPDQLRRRERYRPDSSLKGVKIGRR